jgi:NTE family protein
MKHRKIALALQGGGALGAYQVGAAEVLIDRGDTPDWVAGISIGAINAAILAGNPPDQAVARLQSFWCGITAKSFPIGPFDPIWPRGLLNVASAAMTTATGIPGFFDLRLPLAAFRPSGSPAARSFYDTEPLRATLEKLVDFDRINSGETRLSVGAVNVETGNTTWFDSASTTIGPEHIMASGALPPAFPPVEIDGAWYWDGGLVSNTPLQYIEENATQDTVVYQVDLFSARGAVPASVWECEARQKDIRFSSRTRRNTDVLREKHARRARLRRLLTKLPPEFQDDPDVKTLLANTSGPRFAVAHLIYQQKGYEHGSKDYEFSAQSMREHCQAGRQDAQATLNHPAWKTCKGFSQAVATFDVHDARCKFLREDDPL